MHDLLKNKPSLFLLSMLCIFFSFSTLAETQQESDASGFHEKKIPYNFCMSDEELRAYLLIATSYSWGKGVGGCFLKYPDLSESFDINSILKSFERADQQFTHNANSIVKPVFQRVYGNDAQAAYISWLETYSTNSYSNILNYSHKECENYMHGIMAIFVDKNYKTPMNVVIRTAFPSARVAIKDCTK